MINNDEVLRLKEQVLISPKAALTELLICVDREMRKLLVSTGALKRYLDHPTATLPDALAILGSVAGAKIPEGLEDNVHELWDLRTNVAQGAEVPIRVFECGFTILNALRDVPRPSYIVKKANLLLFSDKYCQNPRLDVKGVLLETFDADGKLQMTKVHPSRREYKEGMSVGWEWNYDKNVSWEDTWYKDPETGRCTPAWNGSMEFIGRDINQV